MRSYGQITSIPLTYFGPQGDSCLNRAERRATCPWKLLVIMFMRTFLVVPLLFCGIAFSQTSPSKLLALAARVSVVRVE